ncbi:hypothetical protein IC582_028221 [Cucumis melo]
MSNQARIDYQIRLGTTIDCARFLLQQGLPFRGHDKTEDSKNQGNFLELLQWLCNHNKDIKVISLKNAPENLKLTAPDIQKYIVNCIVVKIVNSIIQDIGYKLFSILIDESKDISSKEQMSIVLRYVDKGRVIERFVGYDGASNMRGEFNGLKTLILREKECAFYIHCFSHQLQLALVAIAKKNHVEIVGLFILVVNVVNVIGASAKRRDMLREKHSANTFEALNNGDLSSGRGLNQETMIKRPGDTRWGSHYITLARCISMFSLICEVLETIIDDGSNSEQNEAKVLMNSIQSFDFIFHVHLMKAILGITNDLSQVLQRKDQDIVNAMNLVKICKVRLQSMRESGWQSLLDEVSSFCNKHGILMLKMDYAFSVRGKRRRNSQEITNTYHYRVEIFYAVIDMQLQELNNRFTEKSTELLLYVAYLNPSNSFTTFDRQKLICLAQFYPRDFSTTKLLIFEDQLQNYIIDVCSDNMFVGLTSIALILPVTTATVERTFSVMSIIKTQLRNRMEDQWMNDCLVAYIERDLFDKIDNESIMYRFQNMKSRRGHL